jgi:hypothetical protein
VPVTTTIPSQVVATAAQGSERGGNFFIAFSILEKRKFGAILSIHRKHHTVQGILKYQYCSF